MITVYKSFAENNIQIYLHTFIVGVTTVVFSRAFRSLKYVKKCL